jgi:hypothetical protein
VRDQPLPALDVLEVGIQTLRWRQPGERRSVEAQRPREKPARTARVDNERCADVHVLALACAVNDGAIVAKRDAGEFGPVEIHDPGVRGLAHEVVVEVRPVPMRIADVVVRAGGDEQLARMFAVVRKGLSGDVEVKRSALGPPAASGRGAASALRERARGRS